MHQQETEKQLYFVSHRQKKMSFCLGKAKFCLSKSKFCLDPPRIYWAGALSLLSLISTQRPPPLAAGERRAEARKKNQYVRGGRLCVKSMLTCWGRPCLCLCDVVFAVWTVFQGVF